VRVAEAGTYTLDFRSALDLEELNVAPKEFSVLFTGGEHPDLGEAEEFYIFHEPPPDSALGTYELVDPVFYIPTPPTEGQKTAIQAVVTNNGVLAETGVVEFYVTDPDENTVLLATMPVDELRPWRHERPIVEWIPAMPGEHVITARIPGDSPEGEMSVTVNVNAMPYADTGADFFSEVTAVTSFDGTRSSDEDGYLRLFFWDFEDDDQWVGGMTPDRVYENSGTYQVHLYVKDDVNGDGRVSGRDRRELRDAYSSATGGPAYTVFADLNGDGRISGLDRRILRASYGTALPDPPPVPAAMPAPSLDEMNSDGQSAASPGVLSDADDVLAMAAASTALVAETMHAVPAEPPDGKLAVDLLVSIQTPSVEVPTVATPSSSQIQSAGTTRLVDTAAPAAAELEPDIGADLAGILVEPLDAALAID